MEILWNVTENGMGFEVSETRCRVGELWRILQNR
jgi:hypothetical protein